MEVTSIWSNDLPPGLLRFKEKNIKHVKVKRRKERYRDTSPVRKSKTVFKKQKKKKRVFISGSEYRLVSKKRDTIYEVITKRSKGRIHLELFSPHTALLGGMDPDDDSYIAHDFLYLEQKKKNKEQWQRLVAVDLRHVDMIEDLEWYYKAKDTTQSESEKSDSDMDDESSHFSSEYSGDSSESFEPECANLTKFLSSVTNKGKVNGAFGKWNFEFTYNSGGEFFLNKLSFKIN